MAHDALERTLEHIASLSASDGCEATRFAFCIGSTAPLKDVLPAGLTLKRHSLFATFVRDEDAVCDGRPEKKGSFIHLKERELLSFRHDSRQRMAHTPHRISPRSSSFVSTAPRTTRHKKPDVDELPALVQSQKASQLLHSRGQPPSRRWRWFVRQPVSLFLTFTAELMTLHLYHVLLSSGIGGHFFTSDEDFVDKRRCSEAVEEPPASDSSDDESDTETRMAAETLTVYGVVRRVRATRNSTEEEEEEREEEANEQDADE